MNCCEFRCCLSLLVVAAFFGQYNAAGAIDNLLGQRRFRRTAGVVLGEAHAGRPDAKALSTA